jgi:hypothetical protein
MGATHASARVGRRAGFLACVALALLAALSSCARDEEHAPGSDLRFELVRVEWTPHATMGDEDVRAWFALVNDSREPVAFWGGMGERPSYRLAYQSEGRWVERTPAWVECGTGLDVGVLQPGERVELEVWVPRPDLPLRVGAGVWTPFDAPRPPWTGWRWIWTDALVLDELR